MMAARNIRTWDDVEKAVAEVNISDAELSLIKHCKEGTACILGEDVPMTPSKERNIGADLLRFLLLLSPSVTGGQHTFRLSGAYILEALNLEYCEIAKRVDLTRCTFEKEIQASFCSFLLLVFTGSVFKNGFNGHKLTVKDNLLFNKRFASHETIHLSNAKISGQLIFRGAILRSSKGDTLRAVDTSVGGHLFLDQGFKSLGSIALQNSYIGGALECSQSHFENPLFGLKGCVALSAGETTIRQSANFMGAATFGGINLSGAKIGGQLDLSGSQFCNPHGQALTAESTEVQSSVMLTSSFKAIGTVNFHGSHIKGIFFVEEAAFRKDQGIALLISFMSAKSMIWRNVRSVEGAVDLTGTAIETLTDNSESWRLVQSLSVDRFRYDHLTNPTSVDERLSWLKKDLDLINTFRPQPYQQLAKVYGEMGHDADRRRVLIEKERLASTAHRSRLLDPPFGQRPRIPARWLGSLVLDRVFDWTVGYGYRPARTIGVLFLLFLIATFVFDKAYRAGDFAPNSDVILSSESWQALVQDKETYPNPAEVWSAELSAEKPAGAGAGMDYETFNRYAYAADIVIPIIDLGQERAWAPSTNRGPWGWHAWWLRWVLTITGWIVTAVGAAAITGIIRRD
ncbi:oxidoreductase [Cognatishimia sp. WU-CL00825]